MNLNVMLVSSGYPMVKLCDGNVYSIIIIITIFVSTQVNVILSCTTRNWMHQTFIYHLE